MPALTEQPGLLFVFATLLPLASFLALLLLGAVRWGLRPYAKENPGVDSIFQFLGGNVPGVGPAYCAQAAIALAFVCCAIGFGIFLSEVNEMHELGHQLQHEKTAHAHDDHNAKNAHARQDDKKSDKAKDAKAVEAQHINDVARYNELVHHWEGHVEWARIFPASSADSESGAILTVGFRIDMLSAVMFVMVTFIASLIHLFSIGYMSEELQKTVEDHEVHTAHGHYERRGRYGRFFMYLSLFCFSMLNLVLADNLFQIFVSWELVGICSYLLIGFYFERTSASNAANKAFITNRIGDAGFIIGLMIIWTYFGTFNFEEIFARIRCPEADLHEVIKVNGEPAGHKIIRGNLGPVEATGKHELTLAADGDTALIFPRKPGHFHGPKDQSLRVREAADQGRLWLHSVLAAGRGRPWHLPRLRGQVGAVPAASLAPRRDGRPDARSAP